MKFFFLVINLICTVLLSGQKFAVIGDYRCGDTNSYDVSVLVKSWNPDFIITTGDNFDLSCNTIDYQIGQYYREYIYPYTGTYGSGATNNCFFPVLGNHEYNYNGLNDYLDYFELPGNERYYDFVKGNIHFYMLNSNSLEIDGVHPDSVQGVWLQNALANSTADWNIVVLHHPPYSSGVHGSDTTTQWPYYAWGADAVFSGHEHNYERLYINGVLYLINGTGGAPLYGFTGTVPGSNFRYNETYGAILAETLTDSIIFSFYNIHDSLVDHYTLIKTGNSKDHALSKQILIYPNPAINELNIRFELLKKSKVEITIYDIAGRKGNTIFDGILSTGVYYQKICKDDIFPDTFTSGLFILEVCVNGISYKRKVCFI